LKPVLAKAGIGAPQIVGDDRRRQDRALGREAPPLTGALHHPVPVKHSVRLFLLQPHDHGFHLVAKLIGITDRLARPVRQRLDAVLAIAIEDLVARLARDTELRAQLAHAFAIQQRRDSGIDGRRAGVVLSLMQLEETQILGARRIGDRPRKAAKVLTWRM
jgi:hypothetical protein